MIKYSYEPIDGMQWGDKCVTIAAFKYSTLDDPKHTKLKKATVWFKKKNNKKKGKKRLKGLPLIQTIILVTPYI